MRWRLTRAIGSLLALLVLQLGAGGAPASADTGTSIEFTTTSGVDVVFAENWVLTATTRMNYMASMGPGSPDLGTVDVMLSGRDEPLALGLPIQADGTVYITQPSGIAPIPVGRYQVTAILRASLNSGLTDSRTTSPATLTVTPSRVVASVTPVAAPTGKPVLEASLTGSIVDAMGGVPGGTWTFTVSDDRATISHADVVQEPGATAPLRYPILGELEPGTEYRIVTTFTPVEALSDGIDVQQPADDVFRTPGGDLGDVVAFPLWLLIAGGALVAGLIAAAAVLLVKAAAARAAVAARTSAGDLTGIESLFPSHNPD